MGTKTKKEPRSVAELSHAVAAMCKAELNGKNRFASMDLCKEIMNRCDLVSHHDEFTRQTLRSWIGKVQARFQR